MQRKLTLNFSLGCRYSTYIYTHKVPSLGYIVGIPGSTITGQIHLTRTHFIVEINHGTIFSSYGAYCGERREGG